MKNLLGTYTTVDAPTEKMEEAFDFLVNEFSKLKAKVWMKMNEHDLGQYPSFEVDYPKGVEDDEDKMELFHFRANTIIKEYNDKFSNYL